MVITYQGVVIFLFGIAIGSFLNVLIDRLPQRKGFLLGRSRCDFCRRKIRWYDLFPLLSHLLLLGRCRSCKKKIPFRNFLIELVTGLLFLLVFTRFFSAGFLIDSEWVAFLFVVAIVALLIVILAVDIEHFLIFNNVLITIAVVYGIYLALVYAGRAHCAKIFSCTAVNGATGALILGGSFLLLFYLIGKNSMGMGDVKLVAVLGFLFGVSSGFYVIFIALMAAMIASILLLVLRKARLTTRLPFGAFLSASAISFLVWGSNYAFTWLDRLTHLINL